MAINKVCQTEIFWRHALLSFKDSRFFFNLFFSRGPVLDFNSLPDDKILDLSKLKAFSDDNLNVYQKLKFALGRVENIVGKGENAGYQHFLLFPQCFLKNSLTGSLKVGIVW